MSKLSLHIANWLDADETFDWIRRAQPTIIKVYADAGLDDMKLKRVREISPQTLIVGRVYIDRQELDEIDSTNPEPQLEKYDAAADARNVLSQMYGAVTKYKGLVDVWEGLNEIVIDEPGDLLPGYRAMARAYSSFTTNLAELLHSLDLKFAAYSFSTGNPVHIELWDELSEGLRASDYLALHEYITPGPSVTEVYTGMCNKYREIYSRLSTGSRRPVLITECGYDDNGRQGFIGRLSNDAYLRVLSDYDRELDKDDYVVGAAIYTYGISSGQWRTYEIGGKFARMLGEYIASTREPPPAPEEPPSELPPSSPPSSEPTAPVEPAVPGESEEPTPPSLPEAEPPAEPSAPAQEPPAPAEPALPPAWKGLPFDKARWWTEETARLLQAGRVPEAWGLLLKTLIPWFYATAPLFSGTLDASQSHTAARWYCEQAARSIEANDPQKAISDLTSHVIPWFYRQARPPGTDSRPGEPPQSG